MVELKTAIWICVGFIIYYLVFYFSDLAMKSLRVTNTPNRMITNLRTLHNVNVRTFQRNTGSIAFAWFKTIWINECLFQRKEKLLFTFHHEHYHVKHNHKALTLLMRFGFSLTPMALTFSLWYIWIPFFLSIALLIEKINTYFEKQANKHADKMTKDEKELTRRAR